MTWINNYNSIKCDECNKICSQRGVDEYTPFGCSSYDPLEPLEPSHICKKCFSKVKKRWIEGFKNGSRDGDWQKSRAEIEAAKECELEYVWDGIGILGTEHFINSYQYVDKKLYNKIKKLPYWGWCMKCGSKRIGSYCSNKKCDNCFKSKKELNEKMKSMAIVNYDISKKVK